ncbi:DUF3298 and DUF4163 domain-containing protein [Pedobacter sp. BAL39]|uniref:DUF3298 and DUF4163 domain-containing protein n=1 Tax=Pedobacter sp. BAL39 TaxID=391596 RepID=UPI001E4DFCE5|nr:DUF3298 and DUF4163 domain-containing protein [Pedobacter sp. BAL39]
MKKLAILLISLSFAACQSEKKTNDTTDTTTHEGNANALSFSYDTISVDSKKLVPGESGIADTTTAVLVYPIFKDTQINAFVQEKVLQASVNSPDQAKPKSYQEVVSTFINDFDKFAKENKEYAQTWMLNDRTEVITKNPNYLSLLHFTESFAGGAHPNSMAVYWNYNPTTHQEILLDSLIKPGTMPQLVALAEQIFRKNEKLSPTASLKDVYFFENDRFHLNGNFTITKDGLKFLYNPYEIKAYAFGTTELLIPFAELNTIARQDNLLSTTK